MQAEQINQYIKHFTTIYPEGTDKVNDMPSGVKLTVYCEGLSDKNIGFAENVTTAELGLEILIAKSWILQSELDRLVLENTNIEPTRSEAGIIKLTGVELIAEERAKQLIKWTPEHDAAHMYAEMATVAAALCVFGTDCAITDPSDFIENGLDVWGLVEKTKNDRVRQLQIAGALIAAEIDRINK